MLGLADAGTAAIVDAALLPGGRLLVALGELGVRLYGRDGRVRARWDQPADALVISDAGTRAIAVATRGGVRRLARIDLASGHARTWCEAPIAAWTASYDGRLWIVANAGSFLAIDTTRDGWRAAWGVDAADAGDELLHVDVARAEERWTGTVASLGDAELWQYEGLTLRGRRAVPAAPGPRWPDSQRITTAFAVNPEAMGWAYARLEVRAEAAEPLTFARTLVTGDGELPLPLDAWRPLLGDAYAHVHGLETQVRRIVAAGRFVALLWNAPAWGAIVEVWYLPAQRRCAIVALEGAHHATVRIDDLCLVAGDDLGRLIVVDLRSGAVRHDVRVAP